MAGQVEAAVLMVLGEDPHARAVEGGVGGEHRRQGCQDDGKDGRVREAVDEGAHGGLRVGADRGRRLGGAVRLRKRRTATDPLIVSRSRS
jgi:hypothetical protein